MTVVKQKKSASAFDFVVSPDGSDDHSGTVDAPFATLERARVAVRIHRRKNPGSNIVVRFRGGYYRFDSTVVFNTDDSADAGRRIIYEAWPGERPVFGSGVPVIRWQRATPAARSRSGVLWSAPRPAGVPDCRTLFSRKKGWLPRACSKGFIPEAGGSVHRLVCPAGTLPADAAERGLEIKIIPTYPWAMNLLRIRRVENAGRTAFPVSASTYDMSPVHTKSFSGRKTCWLENAVGDIRRPGQWALDHAQDRFYLMTAGSRQPRDILAPALVELIRVEGTIGPAGPVDKPVYGLVFRGITLMHTDATRDHAGRTGRGLQHDWEMFDRSTAALRFRGAEQCCVENCVFEQIGGTAIRCDLHTRNVRLVRNRIRQAGGSGILLAGYGPGTRDVSQGNEISGNRLEDIGKIFWQSPAIFIWQSGHNRITGNSIAHVPYCAIVVSGRISWSRKTDRECCRTIRWKEIDARIPSSETPLSWWEREPFLHGRDNLVEHNVIHHGMERLGDGNAIYVSGTGRGNLIRWNLIRDMDSQNTNAMIRCDDDQHETTIEGNLMARCCGEGIIFKGTNTIQGNIIYNLRSVTSAGRPSFCRRGHLVLPYTEGTGSVIEHNVFYVSDRAVPLLHEGPAHPRVGQAATLRDCYCDRNVYYQAADALWAKRHLRQQRRSGIERHSLAIDPAFVAPKKNDFRFRADSPVWKLRRPSGRQPAIITLDGYTWHAE